MATKKAFVNIGYTRSNLAHYIDKPYRNLRGADVAVVDGKGNTIQVNVRDGETGYRISINGTTIAQG